MNDQLREARRFNTVSELAAILEDLVTCPIYSKTIRDSAVEVVSPDDRSSAPYISEAEVWEETFSDGSTAFNLRLVTRERSEGE